MSEKTKLGLDYSGFPDIESSISPPMARAITIPVTGVEGIAIYVAASAFCELADYTQALLVEIAGRLTLVSPDEAAVDTLLQAIADIGTQDVYSDAWEYENRVGAMEGLCRRAALLAAGEEVPEQDIQDIWDSAHDDDEDGGDEG